MKSRAQTINPRDKCGTSVVKEALSKLLPDKVRGL